MMMKKLGLTLLIAGLTIGAALAQDATTPAPVPLPQAEASVTGGDEDALRAFILRYVVGNSQGQTVNVTVGALPDDLPFTVPTPETVILYGTVMRAGPDTNPTFYDIAFDTTDTSQAVLDFYKQSFAGADWAITNESVSLPSAFSGQTSAYASFCYQQGVASVSLNAFNEGRGITNVNITAQVPGDTYVCSSPQAQVTDPLLSLIPSLALPEGVTVKSNMGGGFSYYTPTGRSNSVGAILQTERPLADIANDYNAQLAAAGWQSVFSENSDHTALSNWTLSDETGKTWHGTLLIVADNEPNVYNALIYVED